MAKDRNGTTQYRNDDVVAAEDDTEKSKKKSRSISPQNSDSEPEDREVPKRRRSRREKSKSRKQRHRSRYGTDSESKSGSGTDSESEYSDSEEYSDSGSEEEEERRRRKRIEKRRRRRREEEEERERKRSKREKRRRRREKEEKEKRKTRKEKERGKSRAVTDSWGKYGIIRETDMWNKRPEFTAWLAEVKQVNLESLANWEEKQMFKDFMEDHNTATFPSKKYYNLKAYHKHQMEKELKKSSKNLKEPERIVFNDEEQRRQELLIEREKQKEEQVENLKRAMQSGMAQAMKEQSRLREEMAYQYKLGNFEAAAAIQRRLDPDVAM